MTLGQLLLLYAMAGVGVATAVSVALPGRGPARQLFQWFAALAFWPLFLPLLLTPTTPRALPREEMESPSPTAGDDLSRAIAQVDAELEGALHSLDGWAENVLAREKDRLHELRRAWSVQASRIREMDRILSRPDPSPMTPPSQDSDTGLSQRLASSERAVRVNRDRLQQVRDRTHQDLLETLAWVRELASMIHLAKFTGAPASRAEELVAQIAAAVEGLSALTWKEKEEGART